MVFADPDRMHTELFGIERLLQDVGDTLVGASIVVAIVIVAQREVAEFHFLSFSVHSPFGSRVTKSCSRIPSSASAISRPSALPSAATSSPKCIALVCSASATLWLRSVPVDAFGATARRYSMASDWS